MRQNFVLVAFVAALAAALVLALGAWFFARRLGLRSRPFRIAVAVLLGSIVLHQLVQPLYLESWDDRANYELGARFSASDLIGKSASDVEAVFG